MLVERALAGQHALGLLEALLCGAHGFFSRGEAVADGGRVQADDEIAGTHPLAVVLGHLQDHGGHFSAQVGPAGRLDGAGDHRRADQATLPHLAQILRGQQQRRGRLGGGLGIVRLAPLAAGGQGENQGQRQGGEERRCTHHGETFFRGLG